MGLPQRTRLGNGAQARSGSRRRVLPGVVGALALTLALMAVACGGGVDQTSTPTLLSPLSVSDSSRIGDVLSQLPASEQQCIQDALGEAAYNQVLQGTLGDDLSLEHEDIVAGCLSGDSMARIVIGGLSSEVGPLSDATIECMRDSLADTDLTSLALGGRDIENGAASDLTVFLCLTDEEAARANVSFFEDEEISLTQIRCVTEVVDISVFLALGDTPDEIAPTEVLQAMLDCGVDLFTGDGDDSDLTSKQLQCLLDALGPDIQMDSRDTLPTAQEFQALLDCGLDLLTGDGDGPDLTSDQLQCLLGAVGPDFLQKADAEEPLTPEEFQALMHAATVSALGCGVGMPTGERPTSRNNDSSRGNVDDEQKTCLEETLGSDALAEVASEDRHPTNDELEAFAACGVDVPSGDAGHHADDGGSPDERDDHSSKHNLTDTQLACLQDALDHDAAQETTSGDRTPTFVEIQALLTCGVNLPR